MSAFPKLPFGVSSYEPTITRTDIDTWTITLGPTFIGVVQGDGWYYRVKGLSDKYWWRSSAVRAAMVFYLDQQSKRRTT